MAEKVILAKTERIGYIDLFRSFGIIFMIMGHVAFGNFFNVFIHAFHMPMFFFISGYLFKKRERKEQSFGSLVLKKAKTLLLPYLVFGLLCYSVKLFESLAEHKTIEIEPLFHLFWVNTDKIAICGAVWFLTALFFTDIIFFLLDRYVAGEKTKALIVIAIAVFGCFANKILPFELPFALAQSFVGLGFYYIGSLFKKFEEKKAVGFVLNLSWPLTAVFGVAATALIFVNGYVNMRTGEYNIVPLFWLNAVLATVVLLNFSRLIYKFLGSGFIGKRLSEIGKNSIVYLCFNQLAIRTFEKFIFVDESFPTVSKLLLKILIFVLSMAMLFLIEKLITKTKLRVLVGK